MKTGLWRFDGSMGRILHAVAVVAAGAAGPAQPVAAATQIDIVGPPACTHLHCAQAQVCLPPCTS